MSRAVEGIYILGTDETRKDFLRRLLILVDDHMLRIHAWSLMDNHFHLLAEPLEATLSCSMHRLLTGFSAAYNRRMDRKGHVFQGRFHSILVEYETYFRTLVGYIHLNPLRAGIVHSLEDLAQYPWTGHPALIGTSCCDWMEQSLIKEIFDRESMDWRAGYLEYLSDYSGSQNHYMTTGTFRIGHGGIRQVEGDNIEAQESGSLGILGSMAFAIAEYKIMQKFRGTHLRNRREQHDSIEQAILQVCSTFHVDVNSLKSGCRTSVISRARFKLVGILIEEIGISQADTAVLLGISQPAVHHILAKRISQKSVNEVCANIQTN